MANEFVAKNGLISQNNSTVSGSLTVTQGITGSLQGTASWANNATTASYITGSIFTSTNPALSASFATSASQALTSSNIQGGTANYIPLWNTATSLTSSLIYQTGSRIGIGTTTPSYSLDISGSTNYRLGQDDFIRLQPTAIGFGNNNSFIQNPGSELILSTNSRYIDSLGNWIYDKNGSANVIRLTNGGINFGVNDIGTSGNIVPFNYVLSIYSNRVVIGYSLSQAGGATNAPSSHAEGVFTLTEATGSHAEGYSSLTQGDYSHAEGGPAPLVDTSISVDISTLTSFEYDLGSYSVISATTSSIVVPGDASGNPQPVTCSAFLVNNGANNIPLNFNYYSKPIIDSITYNISLDESTFNFSPLLEQIYYRVTDYYTTSSGQYSHAEGAGTQTIGYASHTEGYGTIATGRYQHVQGQFNITSSAQSAFIIGNGTDINNRSNLVFASGSEVQITGSLNTTGSVFFTLTEQSQNNVVLIDTASGQLYYTASSAIGGGGSGAGFPYSGSAVITGSLLVSGSGLTVTGSVNVNGAVTATSFTGDGSGLTNVTATTTIPTGKLVAIATGNSNLF